jgi:transposase
MDMWEPYIQATLAKVPDAAEKIVFDRFHIMGYVGKAVDTGRKQEHRELMESGDETLKGSKYLWLYSRENVPERRRNEFAALRRQELMVGRAWAIKEALRGLWLYVYPASGWNSGNGGTSGRHTAGWNRFARRRRPSGDTSTIS